MTDETLQELYDVYNRFRDEVDAAHEKLGFGPTELNSSLMRAVAEQQGVA